jgi:hypothetical protein
VEVEILVQGKLCWNYMGKRLHPTPSAFLSHLSLAESVLRGF